MSAKRKFKHGLVIRYWTVRNNFETYTTTELPSAEYQNQYIAYCRLNKRMPLGDIRFEVTEHIALMHNPSVHTYD